MSNTLLHYKGFTGSANYSAEDNMMYGEVLNSDCHIEFEGQTRTELECDFRNGVDFYLAACESKNHEKTFFSI